MFSTVCYNVSFLMRAHFGNGPTNQRCYLNLERSFQMQTTFKNALTLSVGAAAAMVVSGAMVALPGTTMAAPIFQSDDTRVDLHGRLRLGLVSDDGNAEFSNIGSRFGFRSRHDVNPDLAIFANTEFRFDGSEVNRDAMQIRNTFFGADVNGVGRFRAGNFDSLYSEAISKLSDLPENTGFRALNTGSQRARGNTVEFTSDNALPVRFGVSAKLQSEADDRKEAISTQAFVGTSFGPVNVAVGYDQANSDFTDGADDALLGFRIDYTDGDWLVGAYYEDQGSTNHLAAAMRYRASFGNVFATVSNLDPAVGDSTVVYTAGASYRFSRPMYTFAEVAAGDRDTTVTVGARYNF